MCAAHTKWETVSADTEASAGRLPSPSVCELRDQYVRPDERRQFPRLPLNLPVEVRRLGESLQPEPLRVETGDISCGGLYFVANRPIKPGTTLDMEVLMADQPLGGPSIRMFVHARVVRIHSTGRAGWTGVGATFDDISFDRDPSPARKKN